MKEFIKKGLSAILSTVIIVGAIPLFNVLQPTAVGAATVTTSNAQTLMDKVLGANIAASDLSYTGNPAQGATFSGATFLPFSDGIILSTGDASQVFCPASTALSAQYNTPGDSDLTSIYQGMAGSGGTTYDAAVLQFSVMPTSDKLSFRYVFASEEYNQSVQFNDLFALYVGGQNIARIPGTSNAVSISTTKGTAFQIDNIAGTSLGFLGYTVEMSCEATVTPNVPVTIRLAIADAGDYGFDSAVFIKADSINFVSANAPTLTNPPATANVGDSFNITCDKTGSLYMVPKGTYANAAEIEAAHPAIIVPCIANVPATIHTSGIPAGTYQVYAVDNGNLMSAPSSDVQMVIPDTTAPAISGVSISPAGWTSSDVSVTVSAADAVGLAAQAYSFNGGVSWQASNSKSYSSNTTIPSGMIQVRDTTGNVAFYNSSVVIDKIDKTAPSFTAANISYTKMNDTALAQFANWLTFGIFFNETVRINVEATDNASGVAGIWYKKGSDSAVFTDTSKDGHFYFDIAVESNFEDDIVLYAQDLAGNVMSAAQYVTLSNFCVENTAPVLSIAPDTASNDRGVYSGNVNFTIRANDGKAGLQNVLIEVNGQKQACSIDSYDTQVTGEQIFHLQNVGSSVSPDGSYTVKATVTDNAGNVSTQSVIVKIDKVNPAGDFAISGTTVTTKNGTLYTREQTVALSIAGTDNGAAIPFPSSMRIANDSSFAGSDWIPYSPAMIWSLSSGNGAKTVYIQFRDEAYNVSSIYGKTVLFDNIAPVVTISAPSRTSVSKGDSVSYLVNVSGSDFITGLDSVDRSSVVMEGIGSIAGNTSKIITSIETISPVLRKITFTIPEDLETDGTVNVKIKAAAASDLAGNLSADTYADISFYTDSIAPVNQNLILETSRLVKGGQLITLDRSSVAAGGNSSDSVRIAPAGYNGTPSSDGLQVTATTGDSSVITAPLNAGEYYLYILDATGNISEASVARITVKNEGPKIELSTPSRIMAKEGQTVEYIVSYGSDASVITLSDADVGIVHTGTADAVASVTIVDGQPLQRKITLSGFHGDGTVAIHLAAGTAEDLVGNPSLSADSSSVLLDNTAPSISGVSGNSSIWLNGDIQLTVNGAADTGSGLAGTAYSFSGAPNEYNWQSSPVSPAYTSNQDVYIYVRDQIGNILAVNKETISKIDKSAPEDAAIDNKTNYTESAWFNTNQLIAADFVKTEGCAEQLQYKLDNGNWTYGEHVNVSAEGIHIVKFHVVDALGRIGAEDSITVKIDKSAPVFTANDISYTTINDTPVARFANWITFGLFFNESVRIHVNVTDSGCGAGKLWVEAGENAVPYEASMKDGQFYFDMDVESGFEGDIVLYAEDALGNKMDQPVTLTNFCAEAGLPELTVTPDRVADSNGWYNSNVNFTIKAQDVNTGILSILAEVNGMKQDCSIDNYPAQETSEKTITLNDVGNVISENGEYVVRVTVTDNAGNSRVSEQTVKIDRAVPSAVITGTDGNWTNHGVTLQFANTNTQVVSGCRIWYTTAEDESGWTEGNSALIDYNFNGTVRIKVVTTAGLEAVASQTVKTSMTPDFDINGAALDESYYIARKITVTGNFAPIASVTYTVNGGEEILLPANGIITRTGRIDVKAVDAAGNVKTCTYTMLPIPDKDSVVWTPEFIQNILDIRSEYNDQSANLTDEEYLAETDAKIRELEEALNQIEIGRIGDLLLPINTDNVNGDDLTTLEQALLDLQVLPVAGELTDTQKEEIQALIDQINGRISIIQDVEDAIGEIDAAINAISPEMVNSDDREVLENTLEMVNNLLDQNNLTEEQRTDLENKKTLITDMLLEIEYVEETAQIIDEKTGSLTPENVKESDRDGLTEALDDVHSLLDETHLTEVQRQEQKEIEKKIEDLIAILDGVKAVEELIGNLPEAKDVVKANKDAIINAKNKYDDLSDDQKSLVDPDSKAKLDEVVEALRKILLYDTETGTTVEGIGGTTFDPATELIVTRVTSQIQDADKTAYNKAIQILSKNDELIDLYDIALMLGNEKIQPDGNVQVRIRITDEQNKYTGLKLISITEEGNVEIIPYTIENGYVIFVTSRFSQYGIIGKAADTTIPDTSDQNPLPVIAITVGISLAVIGISRKKRSRQ